MPVPHASQTGWLNRALAAAPQAGRSGERGVALGSNVPLMMRGPAAGRVLGTDASWRSWMRTPCSASRICMRMIRCWDSAWAMRRPPMPWLPISRRGPWRGGGDNRYEEVIRATAGFLANEAGPRVAVFDTTGWDTHANEGGARGQLGDPLRRASMPRCAR